MAEPDDLNTPLIALVGFLGAVMVFVIVVFLMVIYRQVESEQLFRTDVGQPYGQVADLRTRQREVLASYGWVDQERGVASIPIGRAIDLAVREIRTEGRAAVTLPDETEGPPSTEPEETPTTDDPKEVDDGKPKDN